jgi:glucose-1-phosphate thymidylyltransferase
MKLIIPMAGKGTRLRPHSHTTPKPLLPVAGTSIAERIVQTFSRTINRTVDEIVFVLGDFGPEVEKNLAEMSERQGAKASFYKQDVARGTAHAVYCAAEKLSGEIIVVFADTLFDTNTKVEVDDADSVIWLKQVADPSRFGVAVQTGGRISGFVEKPKEFISDLAIIGVYYFKSGESLKEKIEFLIENNVTGHGNEYQLTDAIDALLKDGNVFKSATVDEWLDCGTISAWLDTSIEIVKKEFNANNTPSFPGCNIIDPVYIGENVTIANSTIGPNASIGAGANISNSTIVNSIVLDGAIVSDSNLDRATIGFNTEVSGLNGLAHIGDHSVIQVKK